MTETSFDSATVKFIKESGLVKSKITTSSDGKLHVNGGGYWEERDDTPESREKLYIREYVIVRDKLVADKLEPKTTIEFDDSNWVRDGGDNSGVSYQEYINNTYSLRNPEEVVLGTSELDIHFSDPMYKSNVTFTLSAKDPMGGFTRSELLKGSMKYYHALYFMYKNFDLETSRLDMGGCKGPFAPVAQLKYCYTDNGISALEYDATNKRWEVILQDYL